MRTSPWIFGVIGVLGCKGEHKAAAVPTVDEAIAAIAPQIEPELARLPAIAAQLATVDRTRPYAGALAPVHTEVGRMPEDIKHLGDAALIYASDLPALDDLPHSPKVRYRHLQAGAVTGCYYALRKRTTSSYPMYDGTLDGFAIQGPLRSGLDVDFMCADLARAKYLVVIDQTDVADATLPTPAGKDGVKEFGGGAIGGTLLVFDLAGGTFLGARPYAAQSSDKIGYTVEVDEHGNEKPGVDDVAAVGRDLDNQVAAAIDRALAGP